MDIQSGHQVVKFGGLDFALNLDWRHERQYFDFIEHQKLSGSLAMDVWVYKHFVTSGDLVLDAGANIGFTSLVGLRSGAKAVHLFEPDPRFCKRLEALAAQDSRLVFHAAALGEKEAELKLQVSTSHNQGSTLNSKHLELFPSVYENSKEVVVRVESIDGMFGDLTFDFFKVDIEGAEFAALKGALNKLRTEPPKNIYVELYDEYHAPVHELLSQFYPYVYRVVCSHTGVGRLFDISTDFEALRAENYIVGPPSYIYSINDQKSLAESWTPMA